MSREMGFRVPPLQPPPSRRPTPPTAPAPLTHATELAHHPERSPTVQALDSYTPVPTHHPTRLRPLGAAARPFYRRGTKAQRLPGSHRQRSTSRHLASLLSPGTTTLSPAPRCTHFICRVRPRCSGVLLLTGMW